MENSIGYIVEIHSGQIQPEGITNETQNFNKGELLKARSEALEFASSSLVELEMEGSEENFAFSVDVYFQNTDGRYQIFGSEYEEVVIGLIEEAKFFQKNGLIKPDELTTIYMNKKTHKEDPGNPIVVVSKDELKHWPDMEYDEVSVLKQDLELIFDEEL
jgi:hypothetical protein